MANMSYCRFQNTYRDLIDCSVNLFDKDMSNDEKMARKNLVLIDYGIDDDYLDEEREIEMGDDRYCEVMEEIKGIVF